MKRLLMAFIFGYLGSLHGPASLAAQQDREFSWATVTLRPRLGIVDAELIGTGVAVRLIPHVVLTAAVQRWAFQSGCPDIFPSTCGSDGWGVNAGARFEPRTGRLRPFLEGVVGTYQFSGDARDGDRTSSVGMRGGLGYVLDSSWELEVGIEFARLTGYERNELHYPAVEIKGLQVVLGIPLNH